MASFNISASVLLLDSSIDTLSIAATPVTTLRESQQRSAGPTIVLSPSIDAMLIAAIPITTFREPQQRSAGLTIELDESLAIPTTGQIWPLGYI